MRQRKRGESTVIVYQSLQTLRKDKNQFDYAEKGFHQYQKCLTRLSIKQLD